MCVFIMCFFNNNLHFLEFIINVLNIYRVKRKRKKEGQVIVVIVVAAQVVIVIVMLNLKSQSQENYLQVRKCQPLVSR